MGTSHELIAYGNSSMTCVYSFTEYSLSISFVPGTVVVAGFTLNKEEWGFHTRKLIFQWRTETQFHWNKANQLALIWKHLSKTYECPVLTSWGKQLATLPVPTATSETDWSSDSPSRVVTCICPILGQWACVNWEASWILELDFHFLPKDIEKLWANRPIYLDLARQKVN